VLLYDEEPAEEQPLHEPAILDFDEGERLLGFEVLPAETFGLATRLERAADRLVAPELVDEALPDRTDAVIAAWLERQGAAPPAEAAAVEPTKEDDDEQPTTEPPATTGPALAAPSDPDRAALQSLAPVADDAAAPPPEGAQAQSDAALDLPRINADEQALADLQGTAGNAQRATGNPNFRSGFVAIVGRPNVGKSTLLNTLLGQKVAITSPKPQTTRVPMRGILNRPEAQVIFIDTPGIHSPRSRLGTFMVDAARRAIPDADVVCFMVDINKEPGQLDKRIAELVLRARAPHILVLNKVDATTKQTADYLQQYRALGEWDMELAISARTGDGVPVLLDEIVRRLPLGPALYPEDQVSDQSERELAAELVREKVLRFTEEEVPHAVAVEVEEWERRGERTYIRMSIYTERESQKSILIGANGAMLKKIGTAARADIERVLGSPVFLDLWVKTRANWRDDPSALHWLGYGKQK
jgi:GTPase